MNTIQIEKGSALMIAHRGVSGLEAENTHTAFVAAGSRSYFGIETDVHVTADGKYVCIHDNSTARVSKHRMSVEKSTYDKLRELQLLDPHGHNSRPDMRIPSLKEYIQICSFYEKTAVLELKNRIPTEHIHKIVHKIDKLHYLEHTIFISFYRENLLDIRELLPDQRLQFLTQKFNESDLSLLLEKKMDLDIDYKQLTQEQVTQLHDNGLKVNCWTVDKPDQAKALIDWGVDYITSNILE